MHGIILGRRHGSASTAHGAAAAAARTGGRRRTSHGGAGSTRATARLAVAGVATLAAALCVLSTSPVVQSPAVVATGTGTGEGGVHTARRRAAEIESVPEEVVALETEDTPVDPHGAHSLRSADANATMAWLGVSPRRAKEQKKQKDIRPFRILTSAEISKRLHGLAGKYSNLCVLTSAQERYGLPAAGSAKDCEHDHQKGKNGGGQGTGGDVTEGCKNWILTIEDSNGRAAEGTDTAKTLPEVFLSGALHGDERVGPTAVTEVAALLLDAAACEALPRNVEDVQDPALEMRMALDCRSDLRDRGVDDEGRRWLARLVATRRIVIVPTANALGYERKRRTEGNIDPNRDFPYDLEDWSLCMQTVAGRTINEIFREHVFQLSITFHGGMEAVAYEWGAPTYLKSTSPDDVAQAQIASGYSRYAGGFSSSNGKSKTPPYQFGTMNDVVYYVRGGMEDWAYAASWDPDRAQSCVPKTFGGYPPEKTVYDEATLRAFNMLVESSNDKTPREDKLGTTEDLLSFGDESAGNGYIARNIRLSLLAIDLVEPYLSVRAVDGAVLSDDAVPSAGIREGRTIAERKAVRVAPGRKDVRVEWTAGGGFSVEETSLILAKWDDLPETVDGVGHPSAEDFEKVGKDKLTTVMAVKSAGTTRWHPQGPSPVPPQGSLVPLFGATVDTTKYQPGDKVAVFAVGKFDQEWSTQPSPGPDGAVKPEGPPRSHVVRARTDPEWHMVQEATGKVVKGRYDWYSIPVTLIIGEEGGDKATVELFSRLGEAGEEGSSERKANGTVGKQIPGAGGSGVSASGGVVAAAPKTAGLSTALLVGIAAGIGLLAAALVAILRRRRRRRMGYRNGGPVRGESEVWDTGFVEENDDDEDVDGSLQQKKPYTDHPEQEGGSVELPERFSID